MNPSQLISQAAVLLTLSQCAHLAASNTISEANEGLFQACLSPGGDEDMLVDAAKEALQNHKNGSDIDAISEKLGQTALMVAVLGGKAKIVKYLLDKGADPNIPDNQGYLPSHGAAIEGNADVMKVLIDAGVDVNVYHEDGFLPLHRTCWGGSKEHVEVLRVLLQHGIPYDVESRHGFTCEQMADSDEIIEVLSEISGIDFSANDDDYPVTEDPYRNRYDDDDDYYDEEEDNIDDDGFYYDDDYE